MVTSTMTQDEITKKLQVDRSALPHRLWEESCLEMDQIERMLGPAFARHQKAIDACAEIGSENRKIKNEFMEEAWKQWQMRQQRDRELAKTANVR